MFDGNHRSSNRPQRPNRNQRSRRGNNNSNVGIGSSININNNDQNRVSILETSRIQRNARLLRSKRLSAVKRIQKVFRGRYCRRRVCRLLQRTLIALAATEDEKEKNDGIGVIGDIGSSSVANNALLPAFSDRRHRCDSSTMNIDDDSDDVGDDEKTVDDLEYCASLIGSIVAFRLSPPLLPFLHENDNTNSSTNDNSCIASCGTVNDCGDMKSWQMLLALQKAIDDASSHHTKSGTGLVSLVNRPKFSPHYHAKSIPQSSIVCNRILCKALELLRNLIPTEKNIVNTSNQHQQQHQQQQQIFNTNRPCPKQIQRLTQLIKHLFLFDCLIDPPASGTANITTTTNVSDENDSNNELIITLLLCLRDWLYYATNHQFSISFNQQQQLESKVVHSTTLELLRLSFRIAGHPLPTPNDTTNSYTNRRTFTKFSNRHNHHALFAACILSSFPFRNFTDDEESNKIYNSIWTNKVESCLIASLNSSGRFDKNSSGNDNKDRNNDKSENIDNNSKDHHRLPIYCLRLFESLVPVLAVITDKGVDNNNNYNKGDANKSTVSLSSYSEAQQGKTNVVTAITAKQQHQRRMVMQKIVEGRGTVLLANALSLHSSLFDVFASDRNEQVSLCITIVRLIRNVLLGSGGGSSPIIANTNIAISSSNDDANDHDVALVADLSGIVAMGESIDNIGISVATERAVKINGGNHGDYDDDSDNNENNYDDDANMMDASSTFHFQASASSPSTNVVPSSSRLRKRSNNIASDGRYQYVHTHTRCDLQTTSILNGTYRKEIERVTRDASDSLVELRVTKSEHEEKNRKVGLNNDRYKRSGKGYDQEENNNQRLKTVERLARQIGSGSFLLFVGNCLFRRNVADGTDNHPSTIRSSIQLTSPITKTKEMHDDLKIAREDYCAVLSIVLQDCTGTRARRCARSPLLSKLAFRPEFVEGLWEHVQDSCLPLLMSSEDRGSTGSIVGDVGNAAGATVVFCDLFAHRLLAIDDDEFLKFHASERSTERLREGERERLIQVKEVVVGIRGVLHDLYWARPVTIKDIAAPSRHRRSIPYQPSFPDENNSSNDATHQCHRARLLLSGTKLWNALYERWCRLPRVNPFCPEQCWWFPQPAVSDVRDGGVVTTVIGSGGADTMEWDESSDNGMTPLNEADEEGDALSFLFRDPRMARILTAIPQSLSFERRVKLFTSLVASTKKGAGDDGSIMASSFFMDREQVQIRRANIYKDSMEQLNGLGRDLRKQIQVTFINQVDAPEAGIDGGGVFKEFLNDLIKDAFDPVAKDGGTVPPLFSETTLHTLTVNSGLNPSHTTLSHYEFLGRVLGKAVFESILVEPQFCLPFLNQLLGRWNTLDDLKNFDMEIYRNLSTLRNMTADSINNLELTFELTTGARDGSKTRTVELLEGGASVPVTKQNVVQYVHLVAHRRLNIETSVQTRAFLRGFRDLIPAAWVRLFSAYELQKLIGGDDSMKGIHVDDLRSIMVYSGGYHPSQPIVQWFWEVVEEMTPSQQRMLLKFMTSCSRQPLLGFQALNPRPCVQQVRLPTHKPEVESNETKEGLRLPTSSTCMNLLKLPNYSTKELLRNKLLYSIQSGAGFELS